MPGSTRPGDVVADRYQLIDLLNESRGGRFWRAWDRVLARPVALHLVRSEEDRAEQMLRAARTSATLLDQRLLRVLDAGTIEPYCYVVNEWGEGDSLDQLLAEGPLSPRRAAWVVCEVAELIAKAHAQGIVHGRLIPENVMIDDGGSVRVIGFAVDAALHGLTPGRTASELVDLAALLYAALTGKWAGISRSQVPAAPEEHGHALRPRQVRAGVPRLLDQLCDEVLSHYPGAHDHGYDSAEAIAAALRDYVGDATVVAEAEAARVRRDTNPRMARVIDPEPDRRAPAPGGAGGTAAAGAALGGAAVAGAAAGAPTDDGGAAGGSGAAGTSERGSDADPTNASSDADRTGAQTDDADASDDARASDATPATTSGDDEAPGAHAAAASDPGGEALPGDQTVAGVPVFFEGDDVGWMDRDPEPAPPPPPFEEPPERPLFAPGEPRRTPPPTPADTGSGNGSGQFWPWDTGTGPVPPALDEDDEDDDVVPGRNWMRIAWVIAASLLILVAMIYAFNRGRDDGGGGGGADEPDPSSSSPVGNQLSEVEPTGVADFDPLADPPRENPDMAGNVLDGDAGTTWRTSTYRQNLGPQGLKEGVGLVLDLGQEAEISEVDLVLRGAPTEVTLYASTADTTPPDLAGLEPLATQDATGQEVTLAAEEPTGARWLIVWLTELPPVDGGFRGEVAEVVVRG